MCQKRRVFFSCLHEDCDVTPPREILYCPLALDDEGSSSMDWTRPCLFASLLPLTDTDDHFAGIVLKVPCEVCVLDPEFVRPDIADWGKRAAAEESDAEKVVAGWEKSGQGVEGMVVAAVGEAGGTTPSDPDEVEYAQNYGKLDIDALITRLAQEEEESNIFDFSWLDDAVGQGVGHHASGDVAEAYHHTNHTQPTVGEHALEDDFELFDFEEEFADELEEIANGMPTPPSSI